MNHLTLFVLHPVDLKYFSVKVYHQLFQLLFLFRDLKMYLYYCNIYNLLLINYKLYILILFKMY